jgi:hypothetical protein
MVLTPLCPLANQSGPEREELEARSLSAPALGGHRGRDKCVSARPPPAPSPVSLALVRPAPRRNTLHAVVSSGSRRGPLLSQMNSGGERTRTADFYDANVALYQLSYTPGTGQISRAHETVPSGCRRPQE